MVVSFIKTCSFVENCLKSPNMELLMEMLTSTGYCVSSDTLFIFVFFLSSYDIISYSKYQRCEILRNILTFCDWAFLSDWRRIRVFFQ